jgi:hypothetical protein
MNPGLDKVLTWQAGTTYWSFRPRRTPRKHPGQGAPPAVPASEHKLKSRYRPARICLPSRRRNGNVTGIREKAQAVKKPSRARQPSRTRPGAPPARRVLTINGGSSSIKFALFDATRSLRRVLEGRIERIGLPEAEFRVKSLDGDDSFSRAISAPDHRAAVNALMDWLEARVKSGELAAVGHRVVHGGPKYTRPQRITPELVAELHHLSPFDPQHLPEEILLTEAFHERFPGLPQIACFDTAFHRDMPRVARLLPIPRRYDARGVERYGFHGLSCAFLME